MYSIPNSQPTVSGNELAYLREVIDSQHWHGGGPFTSRCHQYFEGQYGVKKALLTHSGTAALEMAALLADFKPGDEFIVPSYTFASTVNAFILRGGVPVWCDVREDTLNMDESLLEDLVTERTKAIVPVHYAGVGCEMKAILDVAKQHDLLIVEDAAQAISATYDGTQLGTLGHLGCLSFHGSKNVVSGEGGALLINDERFPELAEIIWEKGTNRGQFHRGEVDKYTWIRPGSSFLPSELNAAVLLAQLEQVESTTKRRLALWQQYYERLLPLSLDGKLALPTVPSECTHNAHLFYVLLPTEADRDRLMKEMISNGILAVFHYVPLHSSPAGRQISDPVELPRTEALAKRILRLPLFTHMTADEQNTVISIVEKHV